MFNSWYLVAQPFTTCAFKRATCPAISIDGKASYIFTSSANPVDPWARSAQKHMSPSWLIDGAFQVVLPRFPFIVCFGQNI